MMGVAHMETFYLTIVQKLLVIDNGEKNRYILDSVILVSPSCPVRFIVSVGRLLF